MFENNCHDISNLYKYLKAINKDNLFFSMERALTYNKPVMFFSSSRSVGKSTNIGAFMLLDYLANGYKFIYTRRTKDEMLETCKDYFDNAVILINTYTEFKVEKIEYKSGDYFIKMEGEDTAKHCGYCIPLSLQAKYKSKPFDNVGTILYDEFLPQFDNQYLGSIQSAPDTEPILMNSLYASVDREIGKAFKSGTRLIFSGNTNTVYNPFYVYYGITPYLFKDEKAKFINPKNKVWLLQRIQGVDATAQYENTILYAMSGENERKYNFENNGGDDFNNEWVATPKHKTEHLAFLKLEKKIYEVSRYRADFYIQVYKRQPNDRVISLDFTSFQLQDFMLVKQWHSRPDLCIIYQASLTGSLLYDSVETKRLFTNYFKLI